MGILLFSTISIATILTAIETELPAFNPDNLDPKAAHVCVTVQEESYIEIQSYTSYYTHKTRTWCLSIPPRCTAYRIASRHGYRQVTLYRTRNRYYCCDGYQSALGITYCTRSSCTCECTKDDHDNVRLTTKPGSECTEFLQCAPHTATTYCWVTMICPEGTLFDETLNEVGGCNHAGNVQCDDTCPASCPTTDCPSQCKCGPD